MEASKVRKCSIGVEASYIWKAYRLPNVMIPVSVSAALVSRSPHSSPPPQLLSTYLTYRCALPVPLPDAADGAGQPLGGTTGAGRPPPLPRGQRRHLPALAAVHLPGARQPRLCAGMCAKGCCRLLSLTHLSQTSSPCTCYHPPLTFTLTLPRQYPDPHVRQSRHVVHREFVEGLAAFLPPGGAGL